MYQALFEQFAPTETLWLTASKRLSRYLTKCYEMQQANTFLSPQIIPLINWLEQCWQERSISDEHAAPLLLNQQQEQLLWQEKIDQSLLQEAIFLNSKPLAKQAMQAWKLSHEWGLEIKSSECYTQDTRSYAKWHEQFQAYLLKNNWITSSQLMSELFPNKLSVPKKIVLLGFLEITPALQNMIEQLKQAGCSVHIHQAEEKQSQEHSAQLANQDEEIQAMAEWVSKNREKETICIVPNLNALRPAILRQFKKRLRDDEFNISSGSMLVDEPIIYTALQLLKLNQHDYCWDDISYLLRSPFIVNAEAEFSVRALIDKKIRDENLTTLNQKQFLYHTKRSQVLNEKLTAFFDIKLPKKASPPEWARLLSRQLAAIGWPGERSLSSPEYQALQHWQTVLDRFAGLETVLNNCDFSQAMQQITIISQQTLFQIKTQDASIQVLGLLEANGLSADAAWVMGLSADQWPAAANPNPFIDLATQQKKQIDRKSVV